MALPPIVEKPQRDWLFKVTEKLSKQPARDVCLMCFFFGTGLTTLQINRIQLGDVLTKSGKLQKSFTIRGEDRLCYLSHPKVIESLNRYLDYRVKNKILQGNHPDHYRGLDPDEGLFITDKGAPYSIMSKPTSAGKVSYSSDALNRHIKRLLTQAGVDDASINSGRRTFAVTLHRAGYDIGHIHHLMGNKTLDTTQKLLITDTVNMGGIVANAF
jgi:site-specific recombinase XerD